MQLTKFESQKQGEGEATTQKPTGVFSGIDDLWPHRHRVLVITDEGWSSTAFFPAHRSHTVNTTQASSERQNGHTRTNEARGLLSIDVHSTARLIPSDPMVSHWTRLSGQKEKRQRKTKVARHAHNKQTNKQASKQANEGRNEGRNAGRNEQTKERRKERTNEGTKERTNKQTNKRTNEGTNELRATAENGRFVAAPPHSHPHTHSLTVTHSQLFARSRSLTAHTHHVVSLSLCQDAAYSTNSRK